MKKALALFMAIAIILSGFILIYATDSKEIKVTIDSKEVAFPDQRPCLDNNRTLVPVRFVTQELGAKVDWFDKDKKVVITKGSKLIELVIGNVKVKSGNKEITLDVAASLKNKRTMVPLRFISETLDCDVDWDKDNNIVKITTRKAGDKTPEERIEAFMELSSYEKILNYKNGQYLEIADALYEKYKYLGDKIAKSKEGNGIRYDANGIPEKYDYKTPLMLRFGYAGGEYNIIMFRNADNTSQIMLKDILKIFFPDDYDKCYKVYIEYLNRKPSDNDKSTQIISKKKDAAFVMDNSSTGVVCSIYHYSVNE